MSLDPKLTRYVSEIDQFLQAFDKNHPALSASQKKAMADAKRISLLRDHPQADEPASTLWKDF